MGGGAEFIIDTSEPDLEAKKALRAPLL